MSKCVQVLFFFVGKLYDMLYFIWLLCDTDTLWSIVFSVSIFSLDGLIFQCILSPFLFLFFKKAKKRQKSIRWCLRLQCSLVPNVVESSLKLHPSVSNIHVNKNKNDITDSVNRLKRKSVSPHMFYVFFFWLLELSTVEISKGQINQIHVINDQLGVYCYSCLPLQLGCGHGCWTQNLSAGSTTLINSSSPPSKEHSRKFKGSSVERSPKVGLPCLSYYRHRRQQGAGQNNSCRALRGRIWPGRHCRECDRDMEKSVWWTSPVSHT